MEVRDALRLAILPRENDVRAERREAERYMYDLTTRIVARSSKSLLHISTFSVEDIVSVVIARLMAAFRRKPERLTSMVSDGQAVNYIKLATASAIRDFLRKEPDPGGFSQMPVEELEGDVSVDSTAHSEWQERLDSSVEIDQAIRDVLDEVWNTEDFPRPTAITRNTIDALWRDFFLHGSGRVTDAELTRRHRHLNRSPMPSEIVAFSRGFKRAREVVLVDLLLGERCFGHLEAVMAKLEFIVRCWQRVPKDILVKAELRARKRWPECP